jgi:hypothetical protein
MPSFFSRLKGRDGPSKVKKGAQHAAINDPPPKPRWEDAWTRKTVDPQEIQELLRGCTVELKARGRNMIDILPLSDLQHSIAVSIHVARANFLPPQRWIPRSSFSHSDQPQTQAQRVHLFGITLIETIIYMERVWHKSYG